jgi:5-methyltetrahydropteroyltriglutamate--homocysteine methyltransferase
LGRNIWRANLNNHSAILAEIADVVSKDRLIVQSSSSLLHVPVTVKSEETLDDVLKGALSFAIEKLHEIVLLTNGINDGKESIQ